VEIGLAQFASDVETEIELSGDEAAILRATLSTVQMRTHTNTNAGFVRALDMLETGGRGARADGRLVIILTDGKQNRGPPANITASALKQENVTIIGIGVGSHVDERELESWVSWPSSQHYFPVSDFEALEQILEALLAAACKPHGVRGMSSWQHKHT
jgi:hypothetical protein